MIILVVAAAVLVGWLLYVVAGLTIGDIHLPRIHAGSLQGVSGGAPVISTGNGASNESAAMGADDPAVDADEPEKSDEPQQLYDETDVEHAVYDRLYGQRGRRD